MDHIPSLFLRDHFADALGHPGSGTAVFQNPHQFAIGTSLLPDRIRKVAGRMAGKSHPLAIIAMARDTQALSEINFAARFDPFQGRRKRVFHFLYLFQVFFRDPGMVHVRMESGHGLSITYQENCNGKYRARQQGF